MSKTQTFDLTGFEAGKVPSEVLAHLERDRWPEFERELYRRRLRKVHYDLCSWCLERPRWSWMIARCRKWEEVERVLNRHKVDYRWKQRRAVIEFYEGEVYRCQ